MIRGLSQDGRPDTGAPFEPILRTRVLDRFETAARYRVVLVVAPAGYGKSVAMLHYLETRGEPYVFYRVPPHATTIAEFAFGLVDAFSASLPGLGATFGLAYEQTIGSSTQGVDLAKWFRTHLSVYRGVIAIDDLHIAGADSQVTSFVTAIVEGTQNRWIIATRSMFDLPVASWLAYSMCGLAIDQDDLGFTLDEAAQNARNFKIALRPEELEQILELTERWPTALGFALQTSTRSVDLRHLATETREMIYQYLAQQVFRTLLPSERDLLLRTCLLQEIDVELLARCGFAHAGAIVENLRRRVSFLYRATPTTYRYHDLFRDFLVAELPRYPDCDARAVVLSMAKLREVSGDVAEALVLYTRVKETTALRRIIRSHGVQLLDRGRLDLVSAATALFDAETLERDPMFLLIRARWALQLGQHERASDLFQRALRLAENDTQRLDISIDYAACVGYQSPAQGIALMEAIPTGFIVDVERRALRASVLGAVSTYERGRQAEAIAWAEESVRLAEGIVSDETAAKVYQRAALVAVTFGRTAQTRAFAERAIALARDSNAFGQAAAAYHTLHNLALDLEDDIGTALGYLERMAECAEKAGDIRARVFALGSAFDLQSQRGDLEAMEAIEKELRQSDWSRHQMIFTLTRRSHALRAAWVGNFTYAHKVMEPAIGAITDLHQRAMALSQYSLYLALDNRLDAALAASNEALETIRKDLTEGTAPKIRNEVVTFGCLTALAMGRKGLCAQRRRDFDSAVYGPMVQELARFAEALETGASEGILGSSLDRIRKLGYGGYARLGEVLRQVVLGESDENEALTPTEIEVLRLFADGRSSKEVAASSGRSSHTIDTHARAIVRKLHCRSRHEAIAIARKLGILA